MFYQPFHHNITNLNNHSSSTTCAYSNKKLKSASYIYIQMTDDCGRIIIIIWSKMDVSIVIFIERDFVPFFEIWLSMFMIQQIIPVFVINFQIRRIDIVLHALSLLQLIIYKLRDRYFICHTSKVRGIIPLCFQLSDPLMV